MISKRLPMLRFKPPSPLTRIVGIAMILTVVFAGGLATGLYWLPSASSELGDPDDHFADLQVETAQGHDDRHPEGDEQVLALTEQAVHNLDLKLGRVARGDYWKTILVPARVVEIPGRSDLSVSAPVTGVITTVHVLPGQSFEADQPLFELRLTDELLTEAQSQLLAVLARRDVVRQEIERLTPLVDTGAVAASKRRESQYNLEQLEAEQAALVQELRGRGMPETAIDSVLQQRSLATSLKIFPPEFIRDEQASTASDLTGYAVENVYVHPGKTVTRGSDLCSIAYHQRLYIEGTAFEEDLPVLNRIMENDWPISAELHHMQRDHLDRPARDSLRLLRVDNHVDEATQTVRFYVELDNEVTRRREEQGRTFALWKFRPGQRLHLRLPADHWHAQWTLPAEAVVVIGPNVVVFAKHRHGDEDHHKQDLRGEDGLEVAAKRDPAAQLTTAPGQDPVQADEPFLELEPIPVRLLHRDDRTVVIADDGQLHADDFVALNQAYKLHLALQMQAAGGGHHHDHAH